LIDPIYVRIMCGSVTILNNSFFNIQAAIEEGVVVGGGCSLLRLSKKIDAIKESSLDNIEQKIGADIFKQALSYPTSLIANNAGMNGNFVVEKVC
jgi:chaperonin GroEL